MSIPFGQPSVSRVTIIAFIMAFGVGCGETAPEMVTVSGQVLLDGKGVTAGAVYFHPDATNSFQKDTPSCQLQLDGTFSVKTFPFGDGVPPGKYKVTLTSELANRIRQPEYGRKDKTLWEVVVPNTAVTDLKLEITSKTANDKP